MDWQQKFSVGLGYLEFLARYAQPGDARQLIPRLSPRLRQTHGD